MIGKFCYQISKLYIQHKMSYIIIVKIEKLYACIRRLSANLVTYSIMPL